jgi:serine phosphatase RsbU (regulator of sigma subunit)/pSer/pThr/pTyr-binding forkhead associated (FHA) protein
MAQMRLRWKDLSGQVQSLQLHRSRLLIGRRADSDIVLPIPEVSRRHAALDCHDEFIVLEDLGSSHGTTVDGVRIDSRKLRPGDRFSIIHTEFELLPAEDATVPEAEPDPADITAFMELTVQQSTAADEGSSLTKLSALLDLEYRWKKQFPAQELFRQILESALDISGAQRALILRRHVEQFEYALGLDAHRRPLPEDDFKASRTVLQKVVATREPVFETSGFGADLKEQESIVQQNLQAIACLPLLGIGGGDAESGLIGVLYLDSRKPMHTLSGLDERILRKLAVETGNVLEKMELIRTLEERRRVEHELQLAQEAQEHLLPRRCPDFAGFQISSFCRPTRYVGGDFYDFMQTGDALSVTLADVSGKGMPASLLSASLQAALAMQLETRSAPAALTAVNNYLCRHTQDARFATLFLLQVHPDGHCTYVNAGHIPTYVYRAASAAVEELPGRDTIVGMFEDVTYEEHTMQLEPGDMVVILSDGLTEAQNAAGEFFEEERLVKLIAQSGSNPVSVVQERILQAIEAFVRGHEQSDDLTLVLLRRDTDDI